MPIGYRTGNIVFVPSNIITLSCLQVFFPILKKGDKVKRKVSFQDFPYSYMDLSVAMPVPKRS